MRYLILYAQDYRIVRYLTVHNTPTPLVNGTTTTTRMKRKKEACGYGESRARRKNEGDV